MNEKKPARDPIAEDARIEALEKRLVAASEREEARNKPQVKGADANYRKGNRVLADLLGGMLGGVVIGVTVDYFADTSPAGLLVGLFLGIVVAFRNIFRLAKTQTDDQSGSEHNQE